MSVKILVAVALVAAVAWGLRASGGSPPPIAVNACGDSAVLSWTPESPREGALFRVRVSGVLPGSRLTGEAAGEDLHFVAVPGDSTSLESFAAIPIDGPDTVAVEVRCSVAAESDRLSAVVASAPGEYPVERLRVAPAFGRRPDSALAARIRRESQRALEVARNSHATPPLWRGSFVLPRDSRVTSGFGHGREFNGTITSRHMGTDFAGATGAPVRAANRGVVRIVDSFFYGGNVVYLDHGAGLTSAYLHLSEQLVTTGDTVEAGQLIGRVGATGRVTGPHLHLIVRYGGVTVDPLSLFEIAGESGEARDPAR